jgi:multidrug resistance efflux pump
MRRLLPQLGRFGVTALVLVVACFAAWRLWVYYMDEPWTRDGRVRADVVGVAPDISGLVAEISVRDNQAVRRGDRIFVIDQARFKLAVQQADAVVAQRLAVLQEATREATRYKSLSNSEVSQEKQQQTEAAQQQAAATYAQAVADRSVAQLNLDRTEVNAPVNGVITNFDLRPGDYVVAGRPVTALVDTDSLYVAGYFEETKLPRIHIGDPVAVRLMGERTRLRGEVESVAGGIEDREQGASQNLLANINPTFSWVRLAQRIPVRVQLHDVPADILLLPGRTATVVVQPRAEPARSTERAGP